MAKNHVWRIRKEYFRQLKSGKKKLEIRVGYHQIRAAQQGDTITFENYGQNEFTISRVTKYDDFVDLMIHEDAEAILPGMTKEGVLAALREIYPPDKEKLGVYAFKLDYIDPKTKNQVMYLRASSLLKDGNNRRFAELVSQCYLMTDWITRDYPDHVDHYYSKYVPGIFDGEREIIACVADGKYVATAIMKKTDDEKKISTLYVTHEYQNRGIATELLEECFKWLGTTKPLVSIADYKLGQFEKIIEKYGWEQTEVLDGFYNNHSKEIVFNGKLS